MYKKINEKENCWGFAKKSTKIFSGSVKNYCKKIYRTGMGWRGERKGVIFLVKLMGYFRKKKNFHWFPSAHSIRLSLKIFHQFFLIFFYVILGFFIIFAFFYSSYHTAANVPCSFFSDVRRGWLHGAARAFAFHVQ